MSEEEKKAIDILKILASGNIPSLNKDIKPETAQIIVNLIEKQQKEIEGGYHKGFIDGRISMKYEAQDKIIEKIKELEQEKENYFEKQVIQGRIDLLK